METVPSCTREHDFEGFGGVWLCMFSGTLLDMSWDCLCTHVWTFCCQVEKIGVQRMPRTNHKSFKKESSSRLLLSWKTTGSHGTPRIDFGLLLVDFGTCLREYCFRPSFAAQAYVLRFQMALPPGRLEAAQKLIKRLWGLLCRCWAKCKRHDRCWFRSHRSSITGKTHTCLHSSIALSTSARAQIAVS